MTKIGVKMGDSPVATVDAGPECDRAVAKAIGWRWDDYGHCFIDEATRTETEIAMRYYIDDGPMGFCPSRYWNDAMLAAQKFGLFGDGHYCALAKDDGWYCILPMSELEAPGHELNGAGLWWPGTPLVARDVSGPLAICRAILKLHHRG